MTRTHLVTGTGSGIGADLVDRLEARGDRVVRVTRDVVDLSDAVAVQAWGLSLELDALDSLLHVAGTVELAEVADLDLDDWQRQLAVNLTARKPEKRSPQTNAYTRKFLLASPWQPKQCAVFAGALRYPRYRWFDRIMIQFIMRMTGGETDTSKEVEYTDWQQVDRFAQEFSQIQYEK